MTEPAGRPPAPPRFEAATAPDRRRASAHLESDVEAARAVLLDCDPQVCVSVGALRRAVAEVAREVAVRELTALLDEAPYVGGAGRPSTAALARTRLVELGVRGE